MVVHRVRACAGATAAAELMVLGVTHGVCHCMRNGKRF